MITMDQGVEFLSPITAAYQRMLTPEAVAFIAGLHRSFNTRRKDLMEARVERQKRMYDGERPDPSPPFHPASARKFSRIVLPPVVRIDSG